MIRKEIKDLTELSDAQLFQPGMTVAEFQKILRTTPVNTVAARRARLFCELASLTKRFINEGVAFEAFISEQGLKNLSAAIYSLEWAKLYYQAEAERQQKAAEGYWKRLWRALCNR